MLARDRQKRIRRPSNPRQGWDESFRRMAKEAGDRLLDSDSVVQVGWDEEEWQW